MSKKLSGAQYRRRRREKMQARIAEGLPLAPQFMPPVRAEDLQTVSAYRHEVNRVYCEMRAGRMPSELATRSTYVLCQAAGLARIEEELRTAALMRDELMRLNGTLPREDLRLLHGPSIVPTGTGMRSMQKLPL